MLTLALMLLTGAGAAVAQDCCGQAAGQTEKKACCQQKNAAIENIMTRTSVRKFKDQPVEAEKVETMLRAAMAAPTAMNKQPWHFVVVNDREALSRLAGEGGRGNMVRTAPLAIVVCGDLTKAADGERQQFWIQDASAAAENLLLAAHAVGLGAVWTSAWPNAQKCRHIQEALSLPENIMPLNITVIGYADEQPEPKNKWKPENVSYNKYGNR